MKIIYYQTYFTSSFFWRMIECISIPKLRMLSISSYISTLPQDLINRLDILIKQFSTGFTGLTPQIKTHKQIQTLPRPGLFTRANFSGYFSEQGNSVPSLESKLDLRHCQTLHQIQPEYFRKVLLQSVQ